MRVLTRLDKSFWNSSTVLVWSSENDFRLQINQGMGKIPKQSLVALTEQTKKLCFYRQNSAWVFNCVHCNSGLG